MAQNTATEKGGVHFASHDEQISPESSGDQPLHAVETITGLKGQRQDLNPEAEQELQQLKTTLQNNMQSQRMQHHAFEPVSLPGSQPASRVHSGTTTPSRQHLPAGSGEPSPKHSPPNSNVHSPPLTPAATQSRDGKGSITSAPGFRAPKPDVMTPQRSPSPQRDNSGAVSTHPKQPPTFSVGPSGDSQPPSKDASPASTAPASPRPKTPLGTSATADQTQSKRQSQLRDVQSADAQFRFGNRDPAIGFSSSGSTNALPGTLPNAPTLPRSSASGTSLQAFDKKSTLFGGAKREHDDSASTKSSEHHGSKSNLKRFFRIGDKHHKDKHHSEDDHERRNGSHDKGEHVPFADDHGLQSKYGKFGKMLGSGAGGSVRLMKRTGDGVVFAVKQFRDRHPYESEKEYNKKVTAEFCIGSTLHHGNIIETIDIVHEKGRWYEVMEYAPFDLFATVMTGKMGREEVTCCTLQILSGVLYLHNMGLAHRDLKLDNVVINDQGIMKLIDFGSAVVFRYPFENDVVMATGVVGSDPYLAPEVYDQPKYDPRMADIWSIAIIFCCMTLRRFPWKAPRLSDNSYRLFVSTPDPDQDKLLEQHRKSVDSRKGSASAPASRNNSGDQEDNGEHKHHHHHHHHNDGGAVTQAPTQTDPNQAPTIKGPLRLLRLLPRETRHIISRMLDLNPKNRATMDEILADPWVQDSLVCRQEENNVVIKAPNHTHTLQPSSSGK